jgi:hypothetical protein
MHLMDTNVSGAMFGSETVTLVLLQAPALVA